MDPPLSKLLPVPVLYPYFGLYCPYLIGPREGFKSHHFPYHCLLCIWLCLNTSYQILLPIMLRTLDGKIPKTNLQGKLQKKPALHHSSPLPLKLICSPQPSSPQKQEYSILSAATSSADTSITSVTINIIICCFFKPVNLSLACIPLTFLSPASSPARNWQMHCYLCIHTYKLELLVPVNAQSLSPRKFTILESP